MNGGNFLYGGLSLYQEQAGPLVTVEFDYSIIGETVTETILELTVGLVAGSATTEQEKMRPMFGGAPITQNGSGGDGSTASPDYPAGTRSCAGPISAAD